MALKEQVKLDDLKGIDGKVKALSLCAQQQRRDTLDRVFLWKRKRRKGGVKTTQQAELKLCFVENHMRQPVLIFIRLRVK